MENIRESIWGINALVTLESGELTQAINFDNAATTPPFIQAMEETDEQMKLYGSVGRGRGQKSAHTTDVYVESREIIKDFVGAKDEKYTVFYAGNTTDGINKLASALITSKNDMVLTTRMEHHANDLPWRARARVLYAEVDDQGRLKIDDIERLLSHYPIKFVTVAAASNATGYINEVHHIAKIAHHYGAKIIVDGAQIAAHREFSMLGCGQDEDIDFFVFSAHKIYAPYGGGAVIGLKEVLDKHIPAFYGGGMVEAVFDRRVCYASAPDSYEAGSPNYPGIVSMTTAINMLKSIGFDYITTHEQELMQRTITAFREIPNVILYADNDYTDDRVGIILFNIDGMPACDVADYLAGKHAIAVRHGAFCAHPYIRRLTREPECIDCTPPAGMVRVSFGIYNNEAEVDALISAVKELASTPPVVEVFMRVGERKNEFGRPFDRG